MFINLENRVWISCEKCGIDFQIKESREPRAHFCSNECRYDSISLPRDFPEPPIIEGAKWIQLGHGKFTLVDEKNFDKLSQYKWGEYKGYAYRQEWIDGNNVKFMMHREIISAPPYVEVDHINGTKLNNRRLNLRLANRSTNAMNRVDRGNGSNSGYRGVYLTKEEYFKSMITCDQKQYYLGTYNDAVTAAEAYDEMARELFGEFARLNFPKDGEQQA